MIIEGIWIFVYLQKLNHTFRLSSGLTKQLRDCPATSVAGLGSDTLENIPDASRTSQMLAGQHSQANISKEQKKITKSPRFLSGLLHNPVPKNNIPHMLEWPGAASERPGT